MKIQLTLPYPVSTNRYWRSAAAKGRVRTYRSKEADEYRDAVKWLAKCEQIKSHDGDYSLEFELHPRQNKDGSASGSVIDLDNALKVALDALEDVIYKNDNQVKQLSIRYGKPVIGGGLTVIAERLFADEG